MKLGYFMRGFGVGVIITVIILSIAFNFSDNYKPSDEETIERAKKLGLVEASNSRVSIDDLLEKEQTEASKDSDVESDSSETEVEIEEETEENIESESQESKTEESETSQNTEGFARIKIKPGMHSEDVAKALVNNNLINDAEDFNRYLVENNHATKIRVGSFDIYEGTSYDEIAGIITRN